MQTDRLIEKIIEIAQRRAQRELRVVELRRLSEATADPVLRRGIDAAIAHLQRHNRADVELAERWANER
jgi:hypothetical protein